MYDIARNAIEYPEDKKPEIIRYLSRLDLDHLNSTDLGIKMTIEGIFYRIGLFIGENIQFAESVSYDDIFSMDIYNKLNNPDFARGLARGLTHNFHSFDKTIQKKLWDLGERIIEFGFGLSYGFGYNLLSLNPETRKRLWDFLRIKNRFEEGFSYGLISESGLLPYLKDYLIINEILDVAVMKDDSYLGRAFGNIFSHINEEIQKRTFNLIEKDQNSRFAGGFSHGLIECFSYLDNKIKEKIWNLVEIDKNTEFANGFGWNISRNFSAIDKETKEKIWEAVEKKGSSSQTANALGFNYTIGGSLAIEFSCIDKETKEKIWEAVEKNPQFANGFASKLEETFSSLDKETKEKIWEAVEKNPQFANGFTSNIKFSSLDEESQKKMMDICQRNHAIAYRLGESFNYDKYFDLFYRHGEDRIKLIKKMFDYGEEQFNSLSKEIQFRLLELAEDNKDFAKSSGFKNKKSLFWKRIKLNHPKRKLSILNRIYQFLHPLISRFSHTDHD